LALATAPSALAGTAGFTFDVNVDASNSAGGSNPGYNNVAYGVNGAIYGIATVTYTYIREPGRGGLLAGLGLLAFSLGRWRDAASDRTLARAWKRNT
jgi:hypothetical protein